jgi:hypothetical protein
MREIDSPEVMKELDVILSKIHNVAAVVGFMIDGDLDENLNQVWQMLDKVICHMISDKKVD